MSEPVEEAVFRLTSAVPIGDRKMTALRLAPASGKAAGVSAEDGVLRFATVGWFEVLLEVAWDPSVTAGTRFAHFRIPDQQPLHSEAIDAGVLSQISGGRQLLRGNTVFGHDHTDTRVLEVWQDSGMSVDVHEATLVVRELAVPWRPKPD